MTAPGALSSLAAMYAELSFLAVGGGQTILPEMQRRVVDVHGWMTAQEFAALFALAQAAPGPNMLVATLVGWRVAGVPGALVATVALCGPSCTLTYLTTSAWHRFRTAGWRAVVQGGLVPVTVGLVAAGAAVLVESTTFDWRAALLTMVVAALVLRTRLNPLWMLTGAAILGLAGVL